MAVTQFTTRTPGKKTLWDLREIVHDIEWETSGGSEAGVLHFKLVEVDEGYTPKNGDNIWFKWDSKKIFRGKVMNVKYTQKEIFTVTAYDNLYLFKSQDSIVWPAGTLSSRFIKICKILGVKYRGVKTKKKLPAEVCDNKSYFEMMKSFLKKQRLETGNRYIMYNNYGVIELRKAPYKKSTMVIGDKSLMSGFEFEKSAEEISNVVRVVRTDKKKKGKESGTANAKNTKFTKATSIARRSIKKYGRIAMVETAKEKANRAQMKSKATKLLKRNTKQKYDLRLTAIGRTTFVPGNSVYVKILSLKQIGYGTKRARIKKAIHRFDTAHLVELEMAVII